MYEYLRGTLQTIQPTYIVLDVGGCGYKLMCANPFHFQAYLGQELCCYTELVVREDSQTLYGFKDLAEKQLFLTLNRVSGIGPKSALSILAADDDQGLVQAIEAGDSQYLMKFPGVGKKTAQQMILDLKGELTVTDSVIVANQPSSPSDQQLLNEVNEALLGLGYSARELKRIEKDLSLGQFQSTQEALSYAFKLLLSK
ncbi:Holliday junction branch migration protein RuvA [Vaginisenegalia massiliensis]|uniref:Holliday junction branch migration protein RuvA n=1 Tax=Vaginisenegalia massiliensis TaxID=2058294 RepID=UPI000F53F0BF|nr:Holliday junction branch migration protein RuvA [Vaginisenegalia massiliensis]